MRVTSGSLWGHFGATSASLLACEGDFGVTLEKLFEFDGNLVGTLGSFCGHYWHLRAALSSLSHFGLTLGALAVSVGDFGSLDAHFAMIVESLWVY